MAEDIVSQYNERIKKFTGASARVNRLIILIALARLVTFGFGIAGSIFAFTVSVFFGSCISTIFIVLFLYLIILYQKFSHRKDYLNYLVQINEEEIDRLSIQYNKFDSGSEFIDFEHPYTADLDLFGVNSLFQYLNRTVLPEGRNRLAELLTKQAAIKEIRLRQQAVQELGDKLDWRQNFQAAGRSFREKESDLPRILEWIRQPHFLLHNRVYKTILITLPFITAVSIPLSFFLIPYNVPITFVLFQLGIVAINLRKINRYHIQISKTDQLLKKYSKLLLLIEQELFTTDKLVSLKSRLAKSGKSVAYQMKTLTQLVDQFDRRLNMLVGFVLNSLLMWDLQCILRLEKWRDSCKHRMPEWFSVLSQFDALNSLAGFRYNHPEYIFPTLRSSPFSFHSKEISHPLLDPNGRVSNNFSMDGPGRFILITGSNMSGKSTFLRTIGVNMILGTAGAPVCAKELEFSPINIYTNMRIRDSLFNGESTFYVELKRLKKIIDSYKKGNAVFVLLDEILKGTNSKDKHFGSEVLIKQLIGYSGTGLIATHDLELGKLEKEFPHHIKNYSFEVQIRDGHFHYDYKIREGICKTINATELMRKMGITL